MDLANLFRNVQPTQQVATPAPAAPAPGAQPATPGHGMPQNNPGADPANAVAQPNLDPLTGKPKEQGSPMDAFKDIFTIDSSKKAPEDPFSKPLLTIDPAKISEAVAKMDFTRGITPTMIQEAQQDPTKFAALLNHTSRQAYTSVFTALTGIMERAVATNNERFNTSLDGKFRNFQINSSTTKNPVLNHPSVKPVLASLRELIARQKPDAHPTEVAQEAEDYFLSMGKAMSSLETENNLDKTKNLDGSAKEVDWEQFIKAP